MNTFIGIDVAYCAFPVVSLGYAGYRMLGAELPLRARFVPNACPDCGYSLEGLPRAHRCPECGFAYDVHTQIWGVRDSNGRVSDFAAVTPAGVVLKEDGVRRLIEWRQYDRIVERVGACIVVGLDGSSLEVSHALVPEADLYVFRAEADQARERALGASVSEA